MSSVIWATAELMGPEKGTKQACLSEDIFQVVVNYKQWRSALRANRAGTQAGKGGKCVAESGRGSRVRGAEKSVFGMWNGGRDWESPKTRLKRSAGARARRVSNSRPRNMNSARGH